MGCGKSTFIKEHNLDIYTLSSDKIRLMFNAPQMNIDKDEIPQFNNKKVWDLLLNILEERMKLGEFTIIDAVHATNESLKIYKKLAEIYRYRLYIIDFTDIDLEEVYKRNLNREEYKIVPKESIDKAYNLFKKEKISSDFKIIKPENFDEIFYLPINFDKYDKIHIIGDIHGCFSCLKKYFDKYPINDNDAYIFVGDYFDRGIENFKTFKLLNQLSNYKNIILLMGNHEDKLYKYACNNNIKMDYNLKNTIKEFEDNNIKLSEIRGFIKKLAQISYIKFGDNTYLINHGGIPYIPKLPLDFYSSNSFIYGINKYEVDIDKIYNDFMIKENYKIYQIHGHRNYHKIKYDQYKYSLNLEGDIEHGGYLRIVTLNKDGHFDYTEIKNNIYNPNLDEEVNIYNLVEDLRKNKFIYEKDLGYIHSFNFTKEAFYNKAWDNITTKARGLFIDINNYKIIARSYNKFFNINEREDTKLDNILKNIVYPVNFYLKYNGFLGILSCINHELLFTTKSSNTGNYVDYFKTIFYKKYNQEQIDIIKNKIINDNVSFVFEVIDNINDPHIIEYSESNLILLDIIYNKTDYNKLDYEELLEFSNKYNIEIKKLVYIVKDEESFKNIIDIISKEDYQYNNEYIEGFVIEDSNNFMVKYKTYYYNLWKYLRNRMEYSILNNNYKYKDDLDKEFIIYLKSKYENKNIDINSINIINERKEFDLGDKFE